MTPQRTPDPDEPDEPQPKFEDVVAALLKVDPKGIAGKNRSAEEGEAGDTPEDVTP